MGSGCSSISCTRLAIPSPLTSPTPGRDSIVPAVSTSSLSRVEPQCEESFPGVEQSVTIVGPGPPSPSPSLTARDPLSTVSEFFVPLSFSLKELEKFYRESVSLTDEKFESEVIGAGTSGKDLRSRFRTYHEARNYNRSIVFIARVVLLQYAIHRTPDSCASWCGLGKTLYRLEKFKEALECLNLALELNETSRYALRYRAKAKSALGLREEALRDLEELIRIHPSHYLWFEDRGRVFRRMKKWNEAIDDFTRAIQIDSTVANVFLRRGLSYRHLDKWDEALKDFDTALGLERNHVDALMARADACRLRHSFTTAIQDYTEALRIRRSAEAFLNRGVCFLRLNFPSQSISDFDEAIKENSDRSYPFVCRSQARNALGEANFALKDATRALELDPTNASALFHRCVAKETQFRREDALDDVNDAIRLHLSRTDTASKTRGYIPYAKMFQKRIWLQWSLGKEEEVCLSTRRFKRHLI